MVIHFQPSPSQHPSIPTTPADWISFQLGYIKITPPYHHGLIDHAFMWFNWQGSEKYSFTISDPVKEQLIEAAYSMFGVNENVFLRNFSLENLSITDLVILYRILCSYRLHKHEEDRTIFVYHMSLIETKLREFFCDPKKKEEIINAIDSSKDSNTKELKRRLSLIQEKENTSDIHDDSLINQLPVELFQQIFWLLDPENLPTVSRVCKYWHRILHSSNLNLLNAKLPEMDFFKKTGMSIILKQSHLPFYDRLTIVYGPFTQSLKRYGVARHENDIPNVHPAILPPRIFEESGRLLQKQMKDKELIEFCKSLPENVKATLPSLRGEGLSVSQRASELSGRAKRLRQELQESEAVQNLTNLPASHITFSSLPEEIKYFRNLQQINQITS